MSESILSTGNINKILRAQSDTTVSAQDRNYEMSEIVQKQLKRMREYYNDWFSGAQVKVYFNDVLADVVAIGWNANQNKSPIYGFNSQTFDAIAKGTFLINGEFTIAFKETAYMHLINEQIKQKYFNIDNYLKNVEQLRSIPKDADIYKLGANSAGRIPIVGGYKAIGKDEFGNNAAEPGSTKIIVSTDTIEELIGSEEDFEIRANALETSIWGVSEFSNDQLIRSDKFDEVGAVDIYGVKYYPIGKGFDIIITYGNMENPNAEHTVKALNDVHIVGSAQSLDPNTGFVIENYVFFARDIDKPVGYLHGFKYKFERSQATTDMFTPLVRTLTISLTDCNPNTQTFITEPTALDSIGLEFQKVAMETKDGRYTKMRLTILAPSDWTKDGIGISPSILTFNPNVRRQLLEFFANKLAERFGNFLPKSYPVVASFQYIINFYDGLDNEFNLTCELE